MLSTASNVARQQSISRTQSQDRSHAGTMTLSARPKSSTKSGQIGIAAKEFRIQVHIYTGELQDQDLQIYGNWCLRC